MKKILLIILGSVLLWSCASNNVTLAHIMETKDINELSAYIKKYPKHKDIAFLKQKLLSLQIAANPKKRPIFLSLLLKLLRSRRLKNLQNLWLRINPDITLKR